MPKPNYVSSISIKFESESISQLRKEATQNQRSLSGEIRHRLNQTLQPRDSEKNQGEQVSTATNQSKIIGGTDGR